MPVLNRPSFRGVPTFVVALLAVTVVRAADPPARPRDESQIRAAAQAYLEAMKRGDGKACAALWTPDGDIVDDLGAVLPGRDTAAATRPAPAGQPQPDVRITDTKLRFLSDDVAIEDGTIEIGPAGGAALSGRFSATWVRHEGAWKLAALREARAAEPSGPAALGQLDWMVGDWVIERKAGGAAAPLAPDAGQPTVELSVKWNDTKTYLVQDVRFGPPAGVAGPALSIAQRVGWDPLSQTIRSWSFGSDGSHGEATWLRNGASWIARSTTVRPDGGQSATINTYTYDGKDRCLCRSVPAHIDAEHAGPISFTLVRKPRSAP